MSWIYDGVWYKLSMMFENTTYWHMLSHRVIAMYYIYFAVFSGIVGFLLSLYFRMVMGLYESLGFYTAGGNIAITAHGLLMIFFFIMPLAIGGVGNLEIPILVGTQDMFFPRLNLLAFGLMPLSLMLLVNALVTEEGPGVGGTVYPPLSGFTSHSSYAVDEAIFALHLSGAASIMSAINFLTTIIVSGGLSLHTPLLVGALALTSVLLIISLPVLAAGITMLLLDRQGSTSFLDYHHGGDPVLFQHLFGFFGHPEVYIIILPVFGIVSYYISVSTSNAVFGHLGMIYAMIAIAIVGFYVGAHHMYTIGMDIDTRVYFSAATMVIAIPTAIKIFSGIFSMGYQYLKFDTTTLYVFGFLVMFTLGGFTGLILANTGLDISLHDTYYVVGHFHYVLSLGAVYGVILAILHFSKYVSGTILNESIGKLQFWMLFIGTNLVFFPMHQSGLMGLPRRIPNFPDCYMELVNVSNVGMILIVVSLLLLIVSMSSITSTQICTTMFDCMHTEIVITRISDGYISGCTKFASYQDSLIVPMFLH